MKIKLEAILNTFREDLTISFVHIVNEVKPIPYKFRKILV